jgi:hypothetical protein
MYISCQGFPVSGCVVQRLYMFIQIVYQHEGDLVFSHPLSDILTSLPSFTLLNVS